jgi:hypothetical protein
VINAAQMTTKSPVVRLLWGETYLSTQQHNNTTSCVVVLMIWSPRGKSHNSTTRIGQFLD